MFFYSLQENYLSLASTSYLSPTFHCDYFGLVLTRKRLWRIGQGAQPSARNAGKARKATTSPSWVSFLAFLAILVFLAHCYRLPLFFCIICWQNYLLFLLFSFFCACRCFFWLLCLESFSGDLFLALELLSLCFLP